MAGMWRRVWIVALAIAAFIWSVMVIGFIYDLATHRHEPSSDVALILISIAFVWVSVRGVKRHRAALSRNRLG